MRRLAILMCLLGWPVAARAQVVPFAPFPTGSGSTFFSGGVTAAASCNNTQAQPDVQTAVNAAAVKGIVTVPAGTCTWTQQVLITGKSLKLVGGGLVQGVWQTIISNGVVRCPNCVPPLPANAPMLQVECETANYVEVTGFEFRMLNTSEAPAGQVWVTGTGSNIAHLMETPGCRLDHNHFNDNGLDASGSRLVHWDIVAGLIDNNTFDRMTADTTQALEMLGDPVNDNDAGYTPWTLGAGSTGWPASCTHPACAGTNKAVYVENNTFTFTSQGDGAIDMYAGGRSVFRHNTLNNIETGAHGLDSSNTRSPILIEHYSNVFVNNKTWTMRAYTIRGGTMLQFGNNYSGTHNLWNDVAMFYYRFNHCANFLAPSPGDSCTKDTCWTDSKRGPATGGLNNIFCGGSGGWNIESWGQADGTQYDIESQPSLFAQKGVGGTSNPTGGSGMRFLSGSTLTVNPDITCTGAATGNCTRYADGDGIERIITAVSVANPTQITFSAAHNFVTGQPINITGTSTTTGTSATCAATPCPVVNGPHTVTFVDATHITIPINVTAVTTGTGSATTPYPARDQIGRGPQGQVSAPVYSWQNPCTGCVNTEAILTVDTGDCTSPICHNETTQLGALVAEGRDYYMAQGIQTNATTPFNGTAAAGKSMGYGTLANRPTTCTPFVGYFASDVGSQGTLYQCTTTNVWTVYYTPYTYPHPQTLVQ